MNDQIILNKKEAIIQMQQKLDGKVKGIVTDHKGEPIAQFPVNDNRYKKKPK